MKNIYIQIVQDLEPVLRDIKISVSNLLDLKSTLNSNELKYGLQTFLEKKFSSKEKNCIYQMILSHALSAERACSGTGTAVLKKFSGTETIDRDIFPDRTSILNFMSDLDMSEKERNLLMTAFDLVSFGGKISIKKSRNLNYFIEMHEGYTFKVNSTIKTSKNVEIYNPFVLCIDGYLESVSEINNILEWCAEVKRPLLLMCRGLDNDVLHTIKTNNDRGSFSIYPFISSFDQDNVNTLVDIAVVCSTDVISSLKGNLITSIDTSAIRSIDSAVVTTDSLIIRNDESKSQVQIHIDNMRKKIEERSDIKDLLSTRLKSLSARSIDIYIPDDIRFSSTSHKIDFVLRWVRDRVSLRIDPKKVTDFYYESLCSSLASLGRVVA